MQSESLLDASFTLPIPSGLELELRTMASNEDFLNTENFFEEYGNIFRIDFHELWNPETRLMEQTSDIDFSFKTDTPQQLRKLAKLLKQLNNEGLAIPDLSRMNNITNSINALWIGPELNPEQVRLLFDKIKEAVDEHNNFFDTVSKHNLSKIINNYEMYSMYLIISDPVNILQAHMPVDSATKPLKDIAGQDKWVMRDINSRTPGNAINKFESICDNAVGKDGISITAVGLKGFFGITLFMNTILNGMDEAAQRRLILGKNNEGVKIPGFDKTFYTFANIRPVDPSTVAYDVLIKLAQGDQDIDAAVVLSALLSLSTDNAKELALSKLKAGTKTLGMYIYGISIGIPFTDISKIMMSDVAGVLNDVAAGDLFNKEDESVRINHKFWEYFELGPRNLLAKYNTNKGDKTHREGLNPYSMLAGILRKNNKYSGSLNPLNNLKISLPKMLSNLGKSQTMTLQLKLDYLEHLRDPANYNHTPEFIRAYNSMIDDIQLYIIQTHTVFSDEIDPETGMSNKTKFEAIKALSEGANELRVVGAIFGLNKGLKTTPQELQKQIDNIRMLIYNRKQELGLRASEEDLIDILKFFYGEERADGTIDYSYRDGKIEAYNEIKCAVNPLEAIVTVPHFRSYFKTLILADQECLMSYKYRETRDLGLKVKKLYGISDLESVIKSANTFIGKYITRKFFESLPDNQRFIEIPAGNVAIDKNMQEFTLMQATTIDLSTEWGQHTFRLWVENEVIPNMLKGITSPNLNSSDRGTAENLFIKNLNWDLFRRTTSGNPEIIAALPINMLPRTDSERADFNTYKDEFNLLNSRTYRYETHHYDYDTGDIIKSPHEMNMVDIFALYAMVANNWQLAENSIVPILEDFLRSGNCYIEEYHKFIDGVDKGTIDIGHAGVNESGYFTQEFEFAIAPRESFNSTYAKIIKANNPTSHRIEFMRKQQLLALGDENSPNDDIDIEDSGRTFNGFVNNPRITDSYASGTVLMETKTHILNLSGERVEVVYNPDNTIESIVINGESKDVKIPKIGTKKLLVGKGQEIEIVDEKDLSIKIIDEYYKCAS